MCQNFLTNSNVYIKNNFPSVYYLLDLMVSTVPAKKNLFQCKGPPLSVFFIFCFCGRVKAFTSEQPVSGGSKSIFGITSGAAAQRDGSWEVLGGDLGVGGSRKGGLPGDLGQL